jgi:hypothetical protein
LVVSIIRAYAEVRRASSVPRVTFGVSKDIDSSRSSTPSAVIVVSLVSEQIEGDIQGTIMRSFRVDGHVRLGILMIALTQVPSPSSMLILMKSSPSNVLVHRRTSVIAEDAFDCLYNVVKGRR